MVTRGYEVCASPAGAGVRGVFGVFGVCLVALALISVFVYDG